MQLFIQRVYAQGCNLNNNGVFYPETICAAAECTSIEKFNVKLLCIELHLPCSENKQIRMPTPVSTTELYYYTGSSKSITQYTRPANKYWHVPKSTGRQLHVGYRGRHTLQ